MYCSASATDWTRSSWRIDTGWREDALDAEAEAEGEAAGWLEVTMRTKGAGDADFSPPRLMDRL